MLITAEMEINEVLAIDEDRMLRTLTWIAPDLARLQAPHPLRAVVGSVTIGQAARLARVPLADMLFALNLAAGEREETLTEELRSFALSKESMFEV